PARQRRLRFIPSRRRDGGVEESRAAYRARIVAHYCAHAPGADLCRSTRRPRHCIGDAVTLVSPAVRVHRCWTVLLGCQRDLHHGRVAREAALQPGPLASSQTPTCVTAWALEAHGSETRAPP